VFARNLSTGADLGASVAVVEGGHLVVDLWGGDATHDGTKKWNANTITNVYSTTKTMVALVALMLIDRGQMLPDDRVAKYWPEFEANGKHDVTIANLMSHTSGLPAWEPPFSLDDLYDWNTATSRLASAAPWWQPGTAFGYHMLTYGHLLGEVVRRITGKSLGQFFRDEIAQPLGIDFHIGLSPAEFSRVSPVFLGEGPRMDLSGFARDSFFMRTHIAPNMGGPETVSTAEWRTAEIGAANGHGNARSVALAQSAISNGGVVLGNRLLRADTIALAGVQQADNVDLVLQLPIRFGLGYALSSPHYPLHADEHVLYWSGFGGSRIINLPERGVTFAYVMNKLRPGAILGDPRGDELFSALLHSLG
jgi:CubicO group peptidase (beta-lactamase class C family)